VYVYHAFSLSFVKYLIALFLVAIPGLLRKEIKLRFSAKDVLIGITISAVVLLPSWYFMSHRGKTFVLLPAGALLFQVFGVAFPEEVYFRGFLQDSLGNNTKALIVVSILFSLAHLPQGIVYGDPYSLLTFFPSLVMGFLYMRTSNVLSSTIFHALANIIFLGFL
jgi:membrane protease YdiL (CAAX protease family)